MEFFKHAKSNCAHFQQTVIHHKDCVRTNYCWLQSKTCEMHPDVDLGCFYFVNVVLPLNKTLQAKWRVENPIMGSFTPVEIKLACVKANSKPKGFKVCSCGSEFEINSPRQTRCPSCSKLHRKVLVSKAVRKHKKSGRG